MKEKEEKYCGNCCWFYGEMTDGEGFCAARRDEMPWYTCTMEAWNCYEYVSRQEMRHHMAVLLLEGFMLHIGLGMTEQLDTETMADFITAVINWKDNEACLREMDRLKTCINALRLRRNGLATRLIAERNRVLSLSESIRKLSRKYKDMKELNGQLNTVVKNCQSLRPYTLKTLGINGADSVDMDDMEEED